MKTRALRAAGVAVLAVALTGSAGEKDPFEAVAAVRVTPPAPAPDVAFRSLHGRDVRLSQLRGRPILLGFFTTW